MKVDEKQAVPATLCGRYARAGACLITVAFCLFYAGMISFRSLPPTEGWYSYYAYLINTRGAVPYLDFELLFPPLYVYLIALFTRIFGYSLMALRVLGMFVYAVTGLFACLIFEKLLKSPLFGAIAGIVTIASLQSEVVQVFYDYIRFMDACVYISIYCFMLFFERLTEDRLRPIEPSLIVGTAFAVLASLFKQSSGLFYLVFCLIFFLFLLLFFPRRKRTALWLGEMAGVTLLLYGVMWIALAAKGALGAYFRSNFRSALSAKSSNLGSMLFGWLGRIERNFLWRGIVFLAVFIVLLVLLAQARKRLRPSDEPTGIYRRIALAWGLLLTLFLILTFAVPGFASWEMYMVRLTMYSLFFATTLMFALIAFALIFKQKQLPFDAYLLLKWFFGFGTAFTLAIAVGTSGGLAESQTALCFGLLAAALLKIMARARLHVRIREAGAIVIAVILLGQTMFACGIKVNQMYAWWGLSTGSYSQQTETVDNPVLHGIKMNKDYTDMYRRVGEAVETYTQPGDEIFVFPHIPILYLAFDRPCATYTAVQWLDVSTDGNVLRDIDTLREKKPKLIVFCPLADRVLSPQERAFRGGQASATRTMQGAVQQLLESDYHCVGENWISYDYIVYIWVRNT